MPPESKIESPAWKEQDILASPQNFFLNFLRHTQNSDGGWGYRPGSQSSAEPTAWSVLALCAQEETTDKVLSCASEWLRRSQLTRGAWPTSSGKDPGCWVTALTCLALLLLSTPSDEAIIRGLKWLCETWPAEGNLRWRLRQWWSRESEQIARQDHSLRGWGWTPNTASWVEPTTYALILLQNVPEEFYPSEARKRMELGERMLYDRACPGGGWNTGNPLVYGVAGVPRIGPTAWALLALRSHGDHATNIESLEWLEQNYKDIRSPGSLALAHLCLRVYGRSTPPIAPELYELYSSNGFMQNIPVVAWASLAVSSIPDWLKCSPRHKGKV